ncbi:hypothetical protein EYC80_005377 [Monilinia laxa]|uniref:NACHT domain-containing protein n=1 Tax=Monilinia laxa TaxID=61186 RepID=A0A5N6KKA8_MONLA|nr:hypothetical protein EYC80_005377 [Monilinia laxa]
MSFGFGIGDILAVIELAQKIRKEFSDAPSQYRAISDDVRSLRIVLQDIEDELSVPDLESKQKNQLKEIVDGCCNVLESLQQTLNKYDKLESDHLGVGKKMKIIWKRIQWDQKDINELRCRIMTNVTLLNKFTTSKKIQEMKNSADQFYKRQDIRELNHESSKILNWLTPINYAPQLQDYLRERQQGTGKWLLESQEFNAWVASEKQILFCPGIPGAGKTILTSIVIEELTTRFNNDKSIGIAYLYCNFRRQHNQKVDDLLSSLLKQLAENQPSLPDAVRDLYIKHAKEHTRPSLAELSQTLQSVTAMSSKVFIIVDALDECQQNHNHETNFLSDLLSLQAKCQLNLFATSRYIPEINEKFNQSTWFLLAKLYLDSLKGKTSVRKIQQALQKLPTGSDAYDFAYTDAMERIEGQPEDEKELAKQVLSWIAYARRPLTTAEIQEAIAVEIDEPVLYEESFTEIDHMVSVCAGLVTVDEESNIIRLVHYTTQEYFNRKQGHWFPNAETYITTICVTYLSFDVFENGICESEEDFEERLRSNQFFDYAAKNWGHHARKSSISDQNLSRAAVKFLKNKAKVDASWQGLHAPGFYYHHRRGYSPYISGNITEMHLTAYLGAENIVQLLLDAGEVEIDLKDSNAETPFWYAVRNNQPEIINLLLNTGEVDIDSKDLSAQTPFFYAVKYGHLETVKLLLNTGKVDIDSKDLSAQTPLSYAAESGSLEIVKLLLNTGKVEIDPKDRDGMTPLWWGAYSGYEAMVNLLVERGANLDIHPEGERSIRELLSKNGLEIDNLI